MNKIGARLCYCKVTGNVLMNISGSIGGGDLSKEQYLLRFSEIFKRPTNSIDVLYFEYGEYEELSRYSTGVKVDLKTLKPVFTYDEVLVELENNTLEKRVDILEEGLQAVLRGDMQTLAYCLYPEDFE